MRNPLTTTFTAGLLAFAALSAGAASAQYDYHVVTSFAPPDYVGSSPNGLVQGSDGSIYGTTYMGGTGPNYGLGTIFKLGANGLEVVYDFASGPVTGPMGTLIRDGTGGFWGTTSSGGSLSGGSIFKWDANGLNVLHEFANDEGIYPYAGVIQGRDGALYGTCEEGSDWQNFGTVWKLDGNTFTVLHRFALEDGVNPQAPLVQGTDGAFYGVAPGGASGGFGTVFKLDSSGFSVVHAFVGGTDDGMLPFGALIQARDGAFYGMTYGGGAADLGTIYKFDATGFNIVHSFTGADGARPITALVQAGDGAFYGTTMLGGSATMGTVFKFDSAVVTVLHHFTGGEDGTYPKSELCLASDGTLYGTTAAGGTAGYGTVYKLSPTQPPNECDTDTTPPQFGAVPVAGPFVLGSGPQTVGPIEATDNCELDAAQCVLSATIDTSTVGTKTVTFRAVDMKGNVSTQTAEYSVTYAPAGTALGQPTRQMLAPMKTSTPNTVKTGSNLPLKFRVADANNNSIGPDPVVADFQVLQKLDGTNPVPVDEVPISTNQAGWAWDPVDQLWHFNLRTKNLTPNLTYLFRVTLVDGTFIDFQIETL